jgi:beta-glucan synthesis-associated protein KRE6
LHYYSHDNAKTAKGFLNISTIQKVNEYRAFNEKTKTFYADKKYVQTAMLQGWNKFCFTGGIVEFSAKLPGKHDVGGLWPACTLLFVVSRASTGAPVLDNTLMD